MVDPRGQSDVESDVAQADATPLRGGAVLRWQTPGTGVLLLASRGGAVPPPAAVERLATLSDLRGRIPADSVVGYRGCDAAHHYFCVPTGFCYCLPRTAWAVTAMPVTLGFCIPLLFVDDHLVTPPPEWSLHLDPLSLQWTLDD